MALWCNGVDISAGTELDGLVNDWTAHGLQFTGARSEKNNHPRTRKPDLLVFHWSGGEGGFRQIYRTLTSRKLGVHLFIAYDGTITQFADLWTVSCAHASAANPRSIGVEMQNKAFGAPHARFPRATLPMVGHGGKYRGLSMTGEQLASAVALAELVTASLAFPFTMPAAPGGKAPLLDFLPKAEQRSFSGVCGHIHFSPKVCPGAQVMRVLWRHSD
jgi:hypothetical protein